MKTVVAGSREIRDTDTIHGVLEDLDFKITELVSGTATGVDTIAEQWAETNNIPIIRFPPADYLDANRPAPLERNEVMAKYASAAVLIWNGTSNGTEHMHRMAKTHELNPIILHRTDSSSLSNWR